MSAWTAEQLAAIGDASEIRIATTPAAPATTLRLIPAFAADELN